MPLKPKTAALLLITCLGTMVWTKDGRTQTNTSQLMRLLETKRCRGCLLAGADLVHADLRQADLRGAQLEGANLSQARLDGANLEAANLRFTSLLGASLVDANLQKANLYGADLRQADLKGAQLTPHALSSAHWETATGIETGSLSFGEIHNAGVEAYNNNRQIEAETWFSQAIRENQDAAISWLARGLTRIKLGKDQEAAQDLNYAGNLYGAMGDSETATKLKTIATELTRPPKKQAANGQGSALLAGVLSAFQYLAPIAKAALTPFGL